MFERFKWNWQQSKISKWAEKGPIALNFRVKKCFIKSLLVTQTKNLEDEMPKNDWKKRDTNIRDQREINIVILYVCMCTSFQHK